ncbi:hypothetical protein RHGRI_028023 [Rhododendron griersonianum]|uniref:Rhodanese domain-containing protein n=1 Tax=Rhododendron griersonianum TaxID=479676 RepID=A0AAV6IE79_9ERIC|nr:hypothetical protein RHGRI_028023 [Rhododendron griersonianum]
MLDSHFKEHLTQSSYEDPFEACLSHFNDIDEDSTIESVNIFLESFIDITRRNLCFVEPPFSENILNLWNEQESNFELKPLPPDPSVEIVGPTEIMSALVTPNNDQIEEEKIVDENDQCSKEFECDFVIRAEPVLSSHRILLEAIFCKQTFPWYAESFYHVSHGSAISRLPDLYISFLRCWMHPGTCQMNKGIHFMKSISCHIHMLPSEEAFAAAVSALGIENKDSVVVYDGKGIFSAARVWW